MALTECKCGKEVSGDGGERCAFHQAPNKQEKPLIACWFDFQQYGYVENSYSNVLKKKVFPLVDVLKHCCPRWYFINHFSYIDLVFEPRSNERKREIAESLDYRGIPWLPIGRLDPKDYGGDKGVEVCYDALQAFSNLRRVMVEEDFRVRADVQLIHYFVNQSGLSNKDEALFYFSLGSFWGTRQYDLLGQFMDNWEWVEGEKEKRAKTKKK